jgi:glyoxylase-like metal-dependent hydrolase (beta-lactamase superfamily II)
VNHWHETLLGCVSEAIGAPLVVHERDRELASERCNVDETFSERVVLDGGFELVPVPGHTSGATAYLHSFVFVFETEPSRLDRPPGAAARRGSPHSSTRNAEASA